MTEVLLGLVIVLLVIIIIVAIVRLFQLIKQQGIQIAILLKHEKEAFKEGMSPAMRLMRARAMKEQTNYLLPSEKQSLYKVEEDAKFSVPYRGSNIDHLLPSGRKGEVVEEQSPVKQEVVVPENVSEEEALKAGSNTLGLVQIDTTGVPPSTAELPVETQSGVVIPSGDEKFTVNGRAGAPVMLRNGTVTTPNSYKPRAF